MHAVFTTAICDENGVCVQSDVGIDIGSGMRQIFI